MSLLRLSMCACLGAVLALLSAPSQSLVAQPKAAPVVPPSPQSPTIAPLFPLAIARGTSIELNLTGANLADPVAVWTSIPAKTSIPTDANNGKDPVKLRIKVEVAADAPAGLHSLRVVTKYGVSNARLFAIDEIPGVVEVDTNRVRGTPQPLAVPSFVSGKIDNESSDWFKVAAKGGQRVAFEIFARRMGFPTDPVLKLYDAKTGNEIPGVYSDDAPGLQTDARTTVSFKTDTDMIVEVRDARHMGGADYAYRLRVSDSPSALAAYPLAVKYGQKVKVGFLGDRTEGLAPVEVFADPANLSGVVYISPKDGGPQSGSPVPVRLSSLNEIVETEPNDDPAKANRLELPAGVSGRFLTKGDVDYFAFAGKKGVKYVAAAETYEVGIPTEVYLIAKTAKGAELAKSNPQNPPRVEFTADADGDYLIHVENLNYLFGPNEAYHLTVKQAEPDFEIVLPLDRIELAPGTTTAIPVGSIVRRDYAGPIELSVVGSPGLSGTLTIPTGMAAPTAPAPAVAYLPLTAKADLAPGAHPFRIQAKATIDGKEVVRIANLTEVVRVSMGNLTYPPAEMLTSLVACVQKQPLYSLSATLAPPEMTTKGGVTQMLVKVQRDAGFGEEIALTLLNPPAGLTAALKPIPKGANEATIPLTLTDKVAAGEYTLAIRGTTKFAGKDFRVDGVVKLVVKAVK